MRYPHTRHLWVLLAAVFLGLLVFIVINNAQSEARAQHNVNAVTARNSASAGAATRRIDQLQGTIRDLTREVEVASADRATEDADINALTEQVRQLGARPVVTVVTQRITTDPTPQSQSAVTPSSTTTTTQVVKPLTTTTVRTTTTLRSTTTTTRRTK